VEQTRLDLQAGQIISTEGRRRIEMPNTRHALASSHRGLIAPIALALAIKAAALIVLYLAFFMPPPPPSPDQAARAVLGVPQR